MTIAVVLSGVYIFSALMPKLQPEPEQLPEFVVYEWCIRPENINNIDWLKYLFQTTTNPYDITDDSYSNERTWSENYRVFLALRPAYKLSENGTTYLDTVEYVFVDFVFNGTTGYTKAVYEYREGFQYSLEGWLDTMSDNYGWTKTLE